MDEFKEFQNKNLDSAIADACAYYNTTREKLEIEIIQDAKSGIFGIVGARKAKVRARRVQLREAVESVLGKQSCPDVRGSMALNTHGQNEKNRNRGKETQPASQNGDVKSCDAKNGNRQSRGRQSAHDSSHDIKVAGQSGAQNARHGSKGDEKKSSEDKKSSAASAPRQASHQASHPQAEAQDAVLPGIKPDMTPNATVEAPADADSIRKNPLPQNAKSSVTPKCAEECAFGAAALDEDDEIGEGLPATPLEQLDEQRLRTVVLDTVRTLVQPILAQEPVLSVAVAGGKVHVSIACDEDFGLLIGREGQTLSALQYMASRIVSHGMGAGVRIQLDAGDYRQRQDDKLREMALALAQRVRESGRSCSTRPLSSYHRRIVHVCLQDMADIQTRSSGDGPMKRVVIVCKKNDKAQER